VGSPDISVIVPTHNRRDLLEDLLSSLATQTFPAERWELIVVDDGSTDGTRELLEARGSHWPTRFTVVSGKHANPGAVRNAGAAAATGRVLLFLDDDMIVVPEFVEAHERTHRQPGQAVIGRIVGAGERRDPWTEWDDAQLTRLSELLAKGRAPGPREFYAGNCSVDSALFSAIGGYSASMERGEDFDLGYRLIIAGARLAYCEEAPSIHRGAHSFERWVQNATAFGRSEVTLARDFGHSSDFVGWYRDRHPLNRMLIRLCSSYPALQPLLVLSLDLAGRASYAAGATPLAIAAHSAIYNLSYWRGLIDAFGPERFWSDLRRSPKLSAVPSL
jgi:glycosyltransferase involved in cell wall biosynthesis